MGKWDSGLSYNNINVVLNLTFQSAALKGGGEVPPLRLHCRLAAAAEGAQDQGPLQPRQQSDTAQEERQAQEAAKQRILRKSQCNRELRHTRHILMILP